MTSRRNLKRRCAQERPKGAAKRPRQAHKMAFDLCAVPALMLEGIFSKMDYATFTNLRRTCKGAARFIDENRRRIANVANVFALQFLKGEYAYIRPAHDENAFLQSPEDVQREFPFIEAQVLGFHTMELADAIKLAPLLRSRGAEMIADNCSEAAMIYMASVLRPKVFYSQGTEISEDILLQPGMQDVETIHIKSPQSAIDFSTCGPRTKILIADLSHAEFPEEDVYRLIATWESGLGNLSRMEFTFNDEYDSFGVCVDLIEHCGALPVFMREVHEQGPLGPVPMDHFKFPHFDRLLIVSNSDSQTPQAAIILFRRGSFTFEATTSSAAFYDALNRHGNALFKEPFNIDFHTLIDVMEQDKQA